jgi:hypothetical protein
MLRVRNVQGEDHARISQSSLPPSAPAASSTGVRRKDYRDHEKRKATISVRLYCRIFIIVGLAVIITTLAYWATPNDNPLKQEAELVAQAAMAAEHQLEREMMEWWSQNGHQKPPIKQNDASDSSRETPQGANRWVDGESALQHLVF